MFSPKMISTHLQKISRFYHFDLLKPYYISIPVLLIEVKPKCIITCNVSNNRKIQKYQIRTLIICFVIQISTAVSEYK